MKVEFKYHYTHQQVDFRDASFHSTEMYCPECGKKDVWQEDGSGDYYEGSAFVCIDCKTVFYMPTCHPVYDDPKFKKLFEMIARARNPDVV